MNGWEDFLASRGGWIAVRVAGVAVGTLVLSFLLELVYRRVFRRLASRTPSRIDDRVFEIFHRAIRPTVVLVGIVLCVQLLSIPEAYSSLVYRFARSIAILVWTFAVVRGISVILREVGATGRIDALQPRTVPLFDTIQKVFLTGFAAYGFFLVWSIDLTAWLASAGVIGIAVGFAAKDSLANLFSGVFILVDSPYKIGDVILLDSGERGRVTDVGIRSTRIVTRDDVEITIPNSQIGAAKITNESGGPYRKRRIDVRVGVSYESDVELVRSILMGVARDVDLVCDDPEPRIRFREMADSALVFSLLFWIDDPEQRGQAVDSVNMRILERFRAEGVQIPFPQRVVHMAAGPGAPNGIAGMT